MVGPQFTRQGSGHAVGGSFAGSVYGVAGRGHHPAHRAQVDDRAATGLLHHGHHRLCGKEGVLEVDRNQLVEHVRVDFFQAVAHIVRCIVDQYRDRPQGVLETPDRRTVADLVGDIAALELDTVPFGVQQRRQAFTLALCTVHKRHLGTLRGEGPHHELANPRSPAGNQHGFVLEVGINRLLGSHNNQCSA